jgi:NADH-quinone oxidoreductase subunit N
MELDAWQSLAYFGPELALGVTALLVSSLGLAKRLRQRGLGELALLGASVSVFLASRLSGWGEVWLFGRLAIVDGFAVFFKVLVGLATVAILWLSLESGEIREQEEGRYCALVIAASLGLSLMASAASLLTAYLSIELASLASRAAMRRPQGGASGPALLDLLSGAAASLAMIAGMSWFSGFAGSSDYASINEAVFQFASANPPAVPFAGALVVGGFGYKVATVAFQDRRPDDPRAGAATPIIAFVAVAFAAGCFAFWIRIFYPTLSRPAAGGAWAVPDGGLPWPRLLLVASIVMMIVGSVASLVQRDARHLLAWSSLAHAGTALVGFASLDDEGLRAMLFYLAASAVANLGAFSVAAAVTRATGRYDIDAYRSLVYRRGFVLAAAMTLFLLSLAGLPPGVGFLAKLHLGTLAAKQEPHALLAVFLLTSVISLCAYGRVIRRMLLRTGETDAPPVRVNLYNAFLIALLAALTLVFGVYEAPLADLTRRSIHFVQW